MYPKFSRFLGLFKSNHVDEDIDHLTAQLSTIFLLLRMIVLSSIADLDMERMFSKIRVRMLTREIKSEGEKLKVSHSMGYWPYTVLPMNTFLPRVEEENNRSICFKRDLRSL